MDDGRKDFLGSPRTGNASDMPDKAGYHDGLIRGNRDLKLALVSRLFRWLVQDRQFSLQHIQTNL
jgi:hypothetical protein